MVENIQFGIFVQNVCYITRSSGLMVKIQHAVHI